MDQETRVYQIPRKVDAGLRFFGLNAWGLIIMLVPLGLTGLIWLSSIETVGKIALSVLLTYGTYLMLTIDLNGQTGFEFIWLLLQHMFSQKAYTLTSSNDFTEPEPGEKHLIRLYRPNKQTGDVTDAGSTQP